MNRAGYDDFWHTSKKGLCDYCDKKRKLYVKETNGRIELCRKCFIEHYTE